MNLETRARAAAENLRNAAGVDVEGGLESLHRTSRRRTAGKVVAALAAVAIGAGVVQIQTSRDDAAPVSPSDDWVLVTPSGGDWLNPLTSHDDMQRYPTFLSADPATKRFLVVDGLTRQTLYAVTPGQRAPLATYPCGWWSCGKAALGPGPDEVTTIDGDARLAVLGPGGDERADLGPIAVGPAAHVSDLAWAPDGETLAEARFDQDISTASLAIVLHHPDSSDSSVLYEFTESAPQWYVDVMGDRRTSFGWGSPQVAGLQWAADSTRLSFVTFTRVTSADTADSENHPFEYQLWVADAESGEVEQIADLGECLADTQLRHYDIYCEGEPPSVAWTPDGKNLTVLHDSTLTTYDLEGEALDTEDTTIHGPLVWLDAK